MTHDIIKKIHAGDHLTDTELDDAIEFYGRLESGLRLLGPHEYTTGGVRSRPTFHLAWVEVQRVYTALRGYRHHRDRREEKP